ncbi:U32 family peptidase [Methanimicrococcus sp. OttesenSCG-928-J09]|nr:U32 family peptidase [Methanimicrococcus sp. OttesenSCG-928-J09]
MTSFDMDADEANGLQENDSSLKAASVSAAPELLAPAGTLLSLLAGIQNGADAIYAGASRFSARAYAGNFSGCELAAGIDYAHAFNKKVYVTLNTLYRDDEMDDVLSLFDELYCHGIDSIIVQDLGLLSRLSEIYPDFTFHASTQMTVHNSYHARFLKRMGVSRIVPARENTIPELEAIMETGVEVETFIHGALCICYSGQCLFSSLVGSRSGNRGKCAQPCRKRYTLLVDGKTVATDGQYLISPKDLNASENIESLIDAGVHSFKIEGRMKKPEYVAGVVSVYRQIIDRVLEKRKNGKLEKTERVKKEGTGIVEKENTKIAEKSAGTSRIKPTATERETLKKLFNRDFTEGYFIRNPQGELMSRKLPYNKGILIGKIVQTDRRNAKINVLLSSELSAHDGISIGDIGKTMNSTEDPRQGFAIKKMYVGRSICSKAGAGETVEIPLPTPADSNRSEKRETFPSVSDSVYKTFDFELQRSLTKTFIPAGKNDEESALFAEQVANDVYDSSRVQLKNSNAINTPNDTQNSSLISSSDSSDISSGPSSSLSSSSLSSPPSSYSPSYLSAYLSSAVFPLAEAVEKLSSTESLSLPISFKCRLQPGNPIQITVFDENGLSVVVESEYVIEAAQKNPFSEAQARDLLFKLGSTIWQTKSAEVSVSGDCFIPVGEFKTVRNKALQALLTERILRRRRASPLNLNKKDEIEKSEKTEMKNEDGFNENSVENYALPDPIISVCVYSENELFAALEAGADRIYAGGDIFKDPLTRKEYGLSAEKLTAAMSKMEAADKEKIYFRTPFITKEEDFESIKACLRLLKENNISGILASNIGVYEFIQSESEFSPAFRIAADTAFNIFNSDAALLFFEQNADSVLLSPELSISEIDSLIHRAVSKSEKYPAFECAVHGRQRLMVTEHPLLQSLLAGSNLDSTRKTAAVHNAEQNADIIGMQSNDSIELSKYILKDAKNYQFPVLTDMKGRNCIYNSKELNAFDLLPKLRQAGVSIFRIDGLGHTSDEIFDLISHYRKGLNSDRTESDGLSADGSEYTKGNYLRGAE